MIDMCNGCEACVNICPKQAISMKENARGFLYPEIDSDLCIKCGLCKKVCSLTYRFNNTNTPKIVAGIASDDIRKVSSSGGIFSILANYVLDKKGYIVGAAFADDFSVNHIIINNSNDLDKLRNSKYMQSRIGYIFTDIKNLLDNDNWVLFCGTPCQCAGLRNYLNKEYDKLFVVDIICTGVPSYKLFMSYLQEKGIVQTSIKQINFRGKQNGWNYDFCLNIDTQQGFYSYPFSQCSYLKAFNMGLSLRDSCYECPFAKIPRVGDISLGDFWEIENIDPSLKDTKGVSIVLINSTKGRGLIDKINNKAYFKEERVANLSAIQPRLFYPTEPHTCKDLFWKNFGKISCDENLTQCLDAKFDVAIFNFWWGNNFGASLTAYALQKLLDGLGYSSVLVKYIFGQDPKAYYNKMSDKFARKHLRTTRLYSTLSEMKELNSLADRFIVGSDQVFRYEYTHDCFFLPFVRPEKMKIAFSASFGTNDFNCKHNRLKKYQLLLSRFDSISVRELSGIAICEKKFGFTPKQVIDPVFAVDTKRYDDLIAFSDRKDRDYVLVYILDMDEKIRLQIEHFAKTKKLKLIYVDDSISVEDWLYLIKNAELVLTDSFHGVCFSVIFNKKFLCVINSDRGKDRFDTIISLLQIPKELFLKKEHFSLINEIKSVDYTLINRRIEVHGKFCLKMLSDLMRQKKDTNAQQCLKDTKLIQELYSRPWRISVKYKIKYKIYKILSKITRGNLKQKYSRKYHKYKTKSKKEF